MNDMEQRIKDNPAVCPYCNGSRNQYIRIRNNTLSDDCKHLTIELVCDNCETGWFILYTIAGVDAPSEEELMEKKL